MADYNAKIDVVVHRAESLIGVNAGGTSNPYITISIGTQSVATPHVAKTINPTYESSFSFTSCALPTILTIRAFNKLAYSDLEDPLGTATLTLFHMQPATTKTVQLSHGGNPNLSQHNSCGSVTISYEISQMPADAAAPPPATSAAPAGVVAAPPAAATPMPVPAAINIEGQAALPVPTSSNLISLNSSLSHHAMTSTGAVPAAAPPAAPQVGSVMATLSPSLTPPSLGAARTPENIIFANPPCAPPPPAMAPPPPMRVEGTADVVSYPIPSLAAAAAAQQQQQPMLMMANGNGSAAGFPSLAPPTAAALPSTTILNMDQFYANNTTHNESRVPVAPNTILGSPAPAVAGYPPVASPSATLLAPSSSSLHDGALLARSPAELATAPAPPSLLYPAAANAPVLSEVPLVAQTTYPAAAAPTAPRSPPLSSSASTSHATTPSSASFAQRSHFVAAMPPPVAAAPEAPAIAAPSLNAAAPSPPAVADVVAQQQQQKQQQPSRTSAQSPKRKVAHAITAGLQSSKTSSHSPTRTSKMAATAAGQPPRRSAATAAAATSSAIHIQQQAPHNIAAIYADREYLFSAAASGADLAIFTTLRTMDPLLSCGFAQCLDYAGRTLLHVAAWHGQLAVLQILLGPTPELPLVDLRALVAPQSGNTILHSAACGGQAAVAQWLRYSHPTAGPLLLQLRNKRGMTAAESAKEAGFDAVSRLLLA